MVYSGTQEEVLGSNPLGDPIPSGPLFVEAVRSPRAGLSFLLVLRFPPTDQKHAGDSISES